MECSRYRNGKKYHVLEENIEIFGACAAAALYRTDVLVKTGFFDSDFFAIYEDVDLSWKIRLAGFKSVLAVKSIVYHKRNISKDVSKINFDWIKNDLKRYHLTKNMLILAIRYHPSLFLLRPLYLIKLILTLLGCSYYSLRLGKIRKTFKV
ncbi:MAG: glycosyltransferase family 2 protein [Methanobacterium sp.]|uniref:glycosyltransferase family 2 protein n=1 Tax=Methanobacterium sp. TaxID=2164 RepID=UPI00155A9856